MAVGALLAGTAECDAVQDRDVVADDGGLANDEAGGVVEEDALADTGGRIDVGLEDAGGAALQIERKIALNRGSEANGPDDVSAAHGSP